MKNILLVFFLTLVSFGFSQKNGPYIDPILQNDVNKWIVDAENYDAKWYREFSKFDSIVVEDFPDDHILGYCDDYSGKIMISRSVVGDPWLLRFVVYHELGHCILGYNHVCDRIAIMNPAINFYPRELYDLVWDGLVRDFFLGSKGIPCPTWREEGIEKGEKPIHICNQ